MRQTILITTILQHARTEAIGAFQHVHNFLGAITDVRTTILPLA